MPEPDKKARSVIETLRTSENRWIALARELIWVAVVVGGIALALFLVSGTWPAVVTIESESMVPHMNVGDLVFVVSPDRFGQLQTWEEGKGTGYSRFGEYGDVLIYKPNGGEASLIPGLGGGIHPIIHRAMAETPEAAPIPVYVYFYKGSASPSEYLPISKANGDWVLEDGTIIAKMVNGVTVPDPRNITPSQGYILTSEQIAKNSGYITKGDNNIGSDQSAYLSRRELGIIQPVKDEWIVGKALFAIPLLGYLPLNIVPVAIILIVLMLGYEYYISSKAEKDSNAKKKKKKK